MTDTETEDQDQGQTKEKRRDFKADAPRPNKSIAKSAVQDKARAASPNKVRA